MVVPFAAYDAEPREIESVATVPAETANAAEAQKHAINPKAKNVFFILESLSLEKF